MATYDELIASAQAIKNETAEGANTATRIGGWMEELANELKRTHTFYHDEGVNNDVPDTWTTVVETHQTGAPDGYYKVTLSFVAQFDTANKSIEMQISYDNGTTWQPPIFSEPKDRTDRKAFTLVDIVNFVGGNIDVLVQFKKETGGTYVLDISRAVLLTEFEYE